MCFFRFPFPPSVSVSCFSIHVHPGKNFGTMCFSAFRFSLLIAAGHNWGEPERAPYGIEKRPPRTIYLFCANRGSGPSMDCLAQTVDRPLSIVCARQSMDCTSSRRGKSEAQAHRGCGSRNSVSTLFVCEL